MGNRSSSHYLPPPGWPHGHGPYSAYVAQTGAYEAKRGGPPGAFADAYMPHPNLRRSMVSLTADSGYLTSPGDSERLRSRGSRISLNHLDFPDRPQQIVFPADLKTIKKLEKMEKKQQKLLKKIGGHPLRAPVPPPPVFLHPQPMPPPPPHHRHPPAPMYNRAMSFDDLHRAQFAAEDRRFREQQCRFGPARFRSPIDRHLGRSSLSTTTTSGQAMQSGGSMTSSPVTSSISDSHNGDRWMSSPMRQNGTDNLSPMSETSAQLNNSNRNSEVSSKGDKPKTVEIKVQRTERVERREKFDNKDWINNNDVYAVPRVPPSYGSRSSLATSQARGESSDIDFSWIRDEEKKLKDERDNAKQLPECYFGMEPPKVDETPLSCRPTRDEKENSRGMNNVRVTTAAFEQGFKKEKREQAPKSRSSTHLEDSEVEYPLRREMGPMARRLHRMQREAEVANRNYNEYDGNRQRWRSSIAF